MTKRGFTLIELLVVISIIAILSVIGLTLFSSVQKSARDARRKMDIDAIAKALEIAKTGTGYVTIDGTSFAGGKVPVDSSNITAGTYYCVYSRTDNTVTTAPPSWAGGTCPTVAAAGEVRHTILDNKVELVTSATNWTVCASLENPVSTYCKSSTQ